MYGQAALRASECISGDVPLLSFRDAKAFAAKLAEQPNLAPLAVFDAIRWVTGMIVRHVACLRHASPWKLLEAATARAAAAHLDAPSTAQSIAIERDACGTPIPARARGEGCRGRRCGIDAPGVDAFHRQNKTVS
jgi:hypothetical protein